MLPKILITLLTTLLNSASRKKRRRNIRFGKTATIAVAAKNVQTLTLARTNPHTKYVTAHANATAKRYLIKREK